MMYMTKKAAILTFHRANNYGAILQSYALCETLKKVGGAPEIIDYWPAKFRRIYLYEYPFSLSKDFFKAFAKKILLNPILERRNSEFQLFAKKYLPLTQETYLNPEEIDRAKFDYEIYICGSDQIWNNDMVDFDKTFFLDFPSAKNKFSYAASFGQSVIPEELVLEYKGRLKGFLSYSVRETSGKQLLYNYFKIDAHVDCDPTLLLNEKEWRKVGQEKGISRLPYLLLYSVNLIGNLAKQVNELAAQTGYRIIYLTSNTSWNVLAGKDDLKKEVERRFDASPEEFITLIDGAEYVLTNSFHGTVFSILFHKKFMSATVDMNGNKNQRIIELLDALGISRRNLELSGVEEIYEEISWQKVDALLLKIRESSMAYLRHMVSVSDNSRS